jgi:hypothetical protein
MNPRHFESAVHTIDQRHARAISTTLTHPLQIAVQELVATNLEAFLNHLGGILVNAVVRGETKDMIDGSGAVGWGAMLADMLDAPVAELAMGDDIDTGEDFVDARTLAKK